ncbi:hypothetical protein BTHERMOSOX_179 [Bathymodiolus thermophilus thioautotrophic gill symbiont]|jgi:hypothetical protein|uniref:Secreted protein n=1 Tax=Bathymodiolus thermophilus thioautotrophic gill symbiont TaxID=2360 RepID=A0A1J5TWJ4_9GAMM|nr:hypothetical protein [Bathymodiolus thermophilus thioautotrophic gill symbiont]OIR25216.1 hypothetical protein BGC33_05750 [Bathymodiolus thermophilus thioautotrophic gill symbiont]CAB5501566.1 hypothetical protein THERMOT_1446 [Bathymodiolus thermophilus thioautotrophic gill symbiont]CAB5504480.1 hypothetical protein THERMOS_1966 [Bathymodiolus thermophilus thioautotrophic gill symbiont]SGZ79052.1 hypothetical protein BTHERMOSOX_179 [Bathymodiolus thermophilus thioautotrophic gill symbiont]
MKNIKKFTVLLMLIFTTAVTASWFGSGEDKKDTETKANKEKTAEECEIPTFAKAIGHKDQWLLHNGCPPREKTEEAVKSK